VKRATRTPVADAVRAQIGARGLIAAVLATGSGLASGPAAALELGDVQVSSFLGQPLRAAIPYRLGPNEVLSDSCVSLLRDPTVNGMPNVARAELSVADGTISITGNTAVREPLMTMRVNIRCAYTPQLTRDYMLFIDPERPATSATAVVAPVAPVAARPATAVATPAPAERRRTVNRDPVSAATRYRVQPGDSLSLIAQRIEDRPIGLWDAAAEIFAANPDAFINEDPNKLKAGAWLDIPDFSVTDAQAGATTEIFREPVAPAPVEPDATAVSAASEAAAPYAAPDVPETALAADTQAAAAPQTTGGQSRGQTGPEAGTAAESPAGRVEPGAPDADIADISVPGDGAEVAAGVGTTTIPDTALPAPEIRSTSPGVTAAAPAPRPPEPESGGIMAWILGALVAVIGGLLVFRQRIWPASRSAPVEPVAAPRPRETAGDTQRLETISVGDAAGVDEPPARPDLVLDADLVMGTGLSEGTDVDLATDFGVAAATDIDFELPEEASAVDTGLSATDILPPLASAGETILESEILPVDDDDDEQEMSVIIDAPDSAGHDDLTEPEFAALQLDSDGEPVYELELTAEQEADLRMLEKDYEHEWTVTQALNVELEKAAAGLAGPLGEEGDDASASDLSSTSIAALDITAQLPRSSADEFDELPAEDVDEALASDLSSTSIAALDLTAQLPRSNADEFDELPAEDVDEALASDLTSTSITALDLTAQLPRGSGDEFDEPEDVEADEAVTVTLKCDDDTGEILPPAAGDDTAETLIGDDDVTAEMPIRRR
jgi:hypothetical protein